MIDLILFPLKIFLITLDLAVRLNGRNERVRTLPRYALLPYASDVTDRSH